MDPKAFLFYLFATITVIAAVRVVTARNPVHSALFLVLTFFSAAAIWLLLRAEFLAITLVLVYIGAVMVLFLFVVMMVDYDNTKALGKLIYTEYVYAFEIAAVILLVAIVAAIALTLRKRTGVKSQNPSEQVKVKASDRLRIVRMPSSTPAAPAEPTKNESST